MTYSLTIGVNFLSNLAGSVATPSLPSPSLFSPPFPYPIPFNGGPGVSTRKKFSILQMLIGEFKCILDTKTHTLIHVVLCP